MMRNAIVVAIKLQLNSGMRGQQCWHWAVLFTLVWQFAFTYTHLRCMVWM